MVWCLLMYSFLRWTLGMFLCFVDGGGPNIAVMSSSLKRLAFAWSALVSATAWTFRALPATTAAAGITLFGPRLLLSCKCGNSFILLKVPYPLPLFLNYNFPFYRQRCLGQDDVSYADLELIFEKSIWGKGLYKCVVFTCEVVWYCDEAPERSKFVLHTVEAPAAASRCFISCLLDQAMESRKLCDTIR